MEGPLTVALNTSAVIPYIGNGTASVFPITFPTFENENIEVEVSDADGNTESLDLNTDFTLANIGKPGVQGSVTLVNTGAAYLNAGKLASGYTLYVKFAANPSQPMKGRDWGQFAPERFERTLDRLCMNIAAVKAIAGKALSLQTGDGASPTLPSLAGNAGKILQVNADESGFEYGVTSDQIQDWKNEAQTAKNDAVTAKEEAEAARDTTAGYVTTAQNAATNAASQASAAQVAKNGAESAAAGAAASQSAAASSVIDANAAKDQAFIYKGQTETARDQAIAAANDTSMVATYKAEVEAARDLTLGYRNDALTYRDDAIDAANDAINAANDAETAMTNAETAMAVTQLFADDAQESAEQSELFSNLSLYAKKLTITVADSPFTIDDDLHADTLIIVDDSGGDVTINMPPVSDTDDQPLWKVGLAKKAATGNGFTVNPNGLNTIGGAASVTVDDSFMGLLLYPGSPTNWQAKYFLSVIAADGFVLSGTALNFGDPGVDGTWRIAQVGSQLKMQQRQVGVWVDADVLNPPA